MQARRITLPDLDVERQHPEALRIVLTGNETSGHLAIIEQSYAKGDEVPQHNHTRESHLVEVLRGSFRFKFQDSQIIVTERELINISDGLWHGFTALDEVNVLRVYIYPAGLEELFRKLEANPKMSKEEADALVGKFGIER